MVFREVGEVLTAEGHGSRVGGGGAEQIDAFHGCRGTRVMRAEGRDGAGVQAVVRIGDAGGAG